MDANGATRCLARLCQLTSSELLISLWPVVLRIARLVHQFTLPEASCAFGKHAKCSRGPESAGVDGLWRGCQGDRRPARHMQKAAQAPCSGRVLRPTRRRDVRNGAETWRAARATQRRDPAGQPGPGSTEHEVDNTFAPGGPRSAPGTEAVGTNCCR